MTATVQPFACSCRSATVPVDLAVGYAISLSELVEIEYLDLDAAKEVARAWLFDNANEFFRLDLAVA